MRLESKHFKKIIFLSDSKSSPTNIPLKLAKSIKDKYDNYEISFYNLNLLNVIKIISLSFQEILYKRYIVIQSHHPKSLIFLIIHKLILKILFVDNLFTCHVFLCELRRFSKIQKNIFKFSRFFVNDYCCVAEELQFTWSSFLKRDVNFVKIGITREEENLIKNSSIKSINTSKISNKKKEFRITWIGRLEKIKRPIYFLRAFQKIELKNDLKLNVRIAGSGSLLPELKKEIKKYKIKFKDKSSYISIDYLGFLDEIEKINLIASTDLYINTSYSEGCLIAAMEFISNPYCKLILPNIKSLNSIYKCERVDFFNREKVDDLSKIINKNIDLFQTNNLIKNDNVYPKDYEEYFLDKAAESFLKVYDKSHLN